MEPKYDAKPMSADDMDAAIEMANDAPYSAWGQAMSHIKLQQERIAELEAQVSELEHAVRMVANCLECNDFEDNGKRTCLEASAQEGGVFNLLCPICECVALIAEK